MTKHLFISKNYSELEELPAFLADKNISLIAQSFLHFEPVAFKHEKPFDILFFTSPRSFLFYTALSEIPKDTLIACTGNKTAEIIKSFDYNVDYFGNNSGDIQAVAEAFKKWCGNKRVFFPVSSISLKTIAAKLDPSQVEMAIVYKTTIVSKPLEYCDIYVFTSPSNVKGFLVLNKITENASVISWGQSTTACLNSYGIQPTHTLSNSSIQDLIIALK